MIETTDAQGAGDRALKFSGFALLYLPLFTVALGYGAVLPILPRVLDRLHGVAGAAGLPLHAGLLTGIYIGAFVVAAPIWGRITDLRGPRPVLLIGLLGYAAATLWFGFVDSLAAAYLARFVAGAFAAGLLFAARVRSVRATSGGRVLPRSWDILSVRRSPAGCTVPSSALRRRPHHYT
jgi:MFS family permease